MLQTQKVAQKLPSTIGTCLQSCYHFRSDQKPGPLGLEDRRIQDGQLSASTENLGNHGPHDGRLHNERAWAAAAGDQWLQVDFLRLVKVTEIWTQGRTDSDPDEWIKSYDVKYSLNAVDFTAFTSYVWVIETNFIHVGLYYIIYLRLRGFCRLEISRGAWGEFSPSTAARSLSLVTDLYENTVVCLFLVIFCDWVRGYQLRDR